ncbi:hypothetical protein SAMN04487951_12910 [Vreelandella arcis]|uniref:Uncharacterized protein n=1 Tax=Vreelandella arcis TaxID=416873 RepID=A0A1H0JL05_9GAMM|nr:hypothetical protein SAMN04487951_12910 [Halomonas arcis]
MFGSAQSATDLTSSVCTSEATDMPKQGCCTMCAAGNAAPPFLNYYCHKQLGSRDDILLLLQPLKLVLDAALKHFYMFGCAQSRGV